MDENLLNKITDYSSDPVFRMRLESLVADHARELAKRARSAEYVAHLLQNPNCAEVVKLQQLAARQSLCYGPDVWVPNEFQTLEDYRLVHCSYGSGAWDRPRSREISLTSAGKKALEQLAAKQAVASATDACKS